jgi:8-oxo-dGTP pyrophosphatase MutT (NUDIX family)
VPHRRSLLALLERYRPLDAADRVQAHRLADFIRREPACFDRTCPEGHVTGSAWLVDPSGCRVLLTHHRKLGLWLQLGGHADGNPDVLAVAIREAAEESGLSPIEPVVEGIFDVDIHPIPARPGEPAHLHYDVRFAFRAGRTDFRVGPESHDLAWVDIDRLAERTQEPSMLRMAEKWKLSPHVAS